MSRVRVRNPIRPGDGDARHGTIGGYTNHACRCPDCTAANNDVNGQWVRKVVAERDRLRSELVGAVAEIERLRTVAALIEEPADTNTRSANGEPETVEWAANTSEPGAAPTAPALADPDERIDDDGQ